MRKGYSRLKTKRKGVGKRERRGTHLVGGGQLEPSGLRRRIQKKINEKYPKKRKGRGLSLPGKMGTAQGGGGGNSSRKAHERETGVAKGMET